MRSSSSSVSSYACCACLLGRALALWTFAAFALLLFARAAHADDSAWVFEGRLSGFDGHMPLCPASYPVTLGENLALTGCVDDGRMPLYHHGKSGWKKVATLDGLEDPENWAPIGVAIASDDFTVAIARKRYNGSPELRIDLFAWGMFGGWQRVETLSQANGDLPPMAVSSWLQISLSGNTLLVGNPGYLGDVGSVLVFTNSGGQWQKTAQIDSPVPNLQARFGESVAISYDTIAVGGPAGYKGGVYVYRMQQGSWTLEASLISQLSVAADKFGWRLKLSGDKLAVLAGISAQVFTRTGSQWSPIFARWMAGDLAPLDIAINARRLIVGQPDVPNGKQIIWGRVLSYVLSPDGKSYVQDGEPPGHVPWFGARTQLSSKHLCIDGYPQWDTMCFVDSSAN